MLKIFLVEDEFVVREGIKNIDWASHGYEFCGEASDGELALPAIQKSQPDIVITDIKMPFMDGLELSKYIRKDCPNTEIVILSGYEEFGYAKEAISLGVSKYLSKPIGAADLIKEIDELKESIEKKKRDSEISEQYRKDMEEDIESDKNKYFGKLVSGTASVSELLEEAEKLGIDLTASCYAVTLFVMSSINHTIDEYSGSLVNAWERLAKLTEDDRVIVFDRDLEGKAIIFKADSEEELSKLIESKYEAFSAILAQQEHLKFYAGIGCTVSRLSELNKSFENARVAFAHRFFDNENRAVYADRMQTPLASAGENVDLSSVDLKSLDRNKLINFLKIGDGSEIEYFLSEFYENIGDNAIKSNMFRQYMAMDIYFVVSDFVTDLGLDRTQIEVVDGSMNVAKDIDSVQNYSMRIMTEAIKMRDSVAKNKYQDVVDSVIKYIEENYTNEDLSLNMLAEHVRFSPNHLSMVFSQQTGVTFIKYLTDFRINKAKEALKCTSLKSSEIALEIGYKDPHYFSYMFKKTTGLTPTQYREGI